MVEKEPRNFALRDAKENEEGSSQENHRDSQR
jgi:hypothetical protein